MTRLTSGPGMSATNRGEETRGAGDTGPLYMAWASPLRREGSEEKKRGRADRDGKLEWADWLGGQAKNERRRERGNLSFLLFFKQFFTVFKLSLKHFKF